MSEFIVIAPADYELVDLNQIINATQYSLEEIKRLEEHQRYGDFVELLIKNGAFPEGKEGIAGVKLVEDRDFYIKYY